MYIQAVALGDLSQKITVPVQGLVMIQLKDVINSMVGKLSQFAQEVTRVSQEVGSEGYVDVLPFPILLTRPQKTRWSSTCSRCRRNMARTYECRQRPCRKSYEPSAIHCSCHQSSSPWRFIQTNRSRCERRNPRSQDNCQWNGSSVADSCQRGYSCNAGSR